jgi:hypothetical protein
MPFGRRRTVVTAASAPSTAAVGAQVHVVPPSFENSKSSVALANEVPGRARPVSGNSPLLKLAETTTGKLRSQFGPASTSPLSLIVTPCPSGQEYSIGVTPAAISAVVRG